MTSRLGWASLEAGVRAYGAAPLFSRSAPAKRFVGLATPRTGSEVLVDLLDSHPAVRCESEILERLPRDPLRYVQGRAVLARERWWRRVVLTGDNGRAPTEAYGFKLMAHHVGSQTRPHPSLEQLVADLRGCGFTPVVVRRRQPLDQALSFLAATQIGYHARRGDRLVADRLDVDPANLLYALVLLEQQVAALEAAVTHLPCLDVTYEADLLEPAAHQRTVDRLCESMGLDCAPVTTDLVRPAPGGWVERIADPSAVARALRATRFAPLAGELG